MPMKFGDLKKLSLREIWPNETKDFTPWLAKSIESLGEVLGMELELAQQEADVGDFSLDLLATEIGSARQTVIENQLTASDHDHLGKLLTYASGYDAAVVIWIAESFRDEHRQTLDWLNRRTDIDTEFFGVTVEVFQIDESRPTYKFNPVVFPSGWRKSKSRTGRGEISEKREAYRIFFQGLIDELREKHKFTNARKGQAQGWYAFGSGFRGIVYEISFALGDRIRAGLYIDLGEAEKNKALFDVIFSDKETVETKIGESLNWERLNEKRASRIAVYRTGSIDSDIETLESIKDWAVEMMLKFKEVLGAQLENYISNIENKI